MLEGLLEHEGLRRRSSRSSSRSRASRGAPTCATSSRSRSTPRPRRTSTTRSRAPRGGRDPRLGAHRGRLVVRARRLAARPRRRRARALDLRARARRADAPARARRRRLLAPPARRPALRDGRGPVRRRRSSRGSRLLPLGDPQRRAAHVRAGGGILAGREQARDELAEALRLAETARARARTPPVRARRAADRRRGDRVRVRRRGRRRAAWLETEPHAHASSRS